MEPTVLKPTLFWALSRLGWSVCLHTLAPSHAQASLRSKGYTPVPAHSPASWRTQASKAGPLATNRPNGMCCCQLFIQAPQLMSAACSPQATAGHSISSKNCSVRDQCLWPATQGALRTSRGVGLAE